MNELVFRCGVDFVYAEDAVGQTVAITGAAFVTGVAPSISPNETAIYTCDASDLLEPRPDGTLSLFGSSTKLAVYGSDQPNSLETSLSRFEDVCVDWRRVSLGMEEVVVHVSDFSMACFAKLPSVD
jgi:hypothetical protein